MKDENCIFCKLANGDIPTNTVYEDEEFRVILDASPATRGHALILPKQHYANLKKSFDSFGIRTALLSSSTKTAERRLLLEALASGEINILLGTHAILQPDVVFARPGLFITDEQHRFGVNQREAGEG